MARYLITGATGFLGRHLVRELVQAGHEVVALVRNPDTADLDGVTLVVGDVLDVASIARAAKGCQGIFHCAGKVSRLPKDAEAMWKVHVLGTRNAVAAAKEAKVRRLVVASTSGTIAVSEDPVPRSEDTPAPTHLVARWPYYRSKLFAEQEALAANGSDLEVVSVNPSLLLGPGDLHGSSTEDIRLVLERKVQAVPRGGVAFVDARDAAVAMLAAMEKGRPGARYLVSAANLLVREFLHKVARLADVPAPFLPLPKNATAAVQLVKLFDKAVKKLGGELPVTPEDVDVAQHFWYCDSQKAERELGFVPRDPLDTLRDTIDDLYARGVVWPRETTIVRTTAHAAGERATPAPEARQPFVDHGR